MRAAAIFSDRMVLQREKPITVWGDGAEGRCVTVTLGGVCASGVVSAGKWRVTLPPMPAADNLTMTIACGAIEIVFHEIAVGEVWLCGGQSNMEFEIRNEQNGKALLETLTPECGVRYFYTPKQRMIDDGFEQMLRSTAWQTASPEQAQAWSAVGLYFAMEIAKKLGVTVGLIGCNWGGTSASCWVSRDILEERGSLHPYLSEYAAAVEGKTEAEMIAAYDEYEAYQTKWYEAYSALMQTAPETTWEAAQAKLGASRYPGPMGIKNECRPCGLYETMLRQVCPYTLRGFLFYQGESDDCKPQTYETLLEGLIGCWRRDWEDPALPFLNVQLPMFRYAHDPDWGHWCLIREAQMRVYEKLRHTGLAVIPDCGALDDLHPADKAPVGHRLALQALYMVYHRIPEEAACAPMYRSSYVQGHTMVIETVHASEGFRLTGAPSGFMLAGADGKAYPASAVFGRNQILLTAEQVPEPVSARYAWANYAPVTVFGMNGLPLAPFRTDAAGCGWEKSAESTANCT